MLKKDIIELVYMYEDCIFTIEKQIDELKIDLKKDLSKDEKKSKRETIKTISEIKEKCENRIKELQSNID